MLRTILKTTHEPCKVLPEDITIDSSLAFPNTVPGAGYSTHPLV